jgi:hypothetical protein
MLRVMPSIEEVGSRKGWDMRDIRADLQERLDAVGRDREELQRRITEIDQIEPAIKALLKRESENFGATSPAEVERDFGSFGANDTMNKEAMSVVRPGHWGELRVG